MARLLTADRLRSAAPLRTPEATTEAFALLREATPSPEAAVDLEAVHAVLLTFYHRHLGSDDPESAWDSTVMSSAFGFLYPRASGNMVFPDALVVNFDPADPLLDARFAHLVGDAHGALANAPDTGEAERLASLGRALAWSGLARRLVPPEHAPDIGLEMQALEFETTRFEMAADPDALARAAGHGRVVCEVLPVVASEDLGPDTVEAAAIALATVADAFWLLGEPTLAEVDRLIAGVPSWVVPPDTLEAVRLAQLLEAHATSWPGQFDLLMGRKVAELGVLDHDAGRIACAVRRLRAALDAAPAGHPARADVVSALVGALEALARERGDEAAAREAAELRAHELGESEPLLHGRGFLDEDPFDDGFLDENLFGDRFLDEELFGDRFPGSPRMDDRFLDGFFHFVENLHDFIDVSDDFDIPGADGLGTMDGRTEEQAEAQALVGQELAELSAALMSSSDPTGDWVSDDQIERFRSALATASAEDPRRHLHVAVLAALAGTRAARLREAEPVRAAELDAYARARVEEAAAIAPTGPLLTGLLADGRYEIALPIAMVTASIGEADGTIADPERAHAAFLLARVADLRPDDLGSLEHNIAVMRDLLSRIPEDATGARAYLSAALGAAVAEQAGRTPDLASAEEIASLLRCARAYSPDGSAPTDHLLVQLLMWISLVRADPGPAREAAAVNAELDARGPWVVWGGTAYNTEAEDSPTALGQAAEAADLKFYNALQNYLLGHDPAELDRARRAALRIKELGTTADPKVARGLGLDVMGDIWLDLVDGIGPNGGLKRDVTDAHVDRCRATFAACPPGHPRRIHGAISLARMLVQRALGLSNEPLRALPLLTEALHVADTIAPAGSERLGEGMQLHIAEALAAVLRLPLPLEPLDPADAAVQEAADRFEPADPVATAMQRLLTLLRTTSGRTADDATTPPWHQAHEEFRRARLAMAGAEPRLDDVLTHLDTAVQLLSQITDRGSDQQSAEHGLMSFDGDLRTITALILLVIAVRDDRGRMRVNGVDLNALPLDALADRARAATGPHVDRVTEILERGRGLLLSRRIETRGDLTELRAASPQLAEEFKQLTELLSVPVAGSVPERARYDRLQASLRLDNLIGRVRELPEFAGFLRPLTADRLRALAADGPMVLLLQSQFLRYAIVVTGQSITTLCLAVETGDSADQARRLRDAIDAINAMGAVRPSPTELIDAKITVQQCLSWTWHTIVRPVLDHLDITEPVPEGGAWPRIWWVPTGTFNALPLHAAQCTLPDCGLHGCGAALDAVVSSYVPGFQTLAHARSRAAHHERHTDAGGGGALIVAAPEDELPGAESAARYAAEVLATPEPLIGAAATRAAVLDALGSVRWAHFGCHAATDPAEPSGARLHLPCGEQLSVVEICQARPDAARLAFLTACGTARSSERLSDEAIHITSAFLLAGFPRVVGTLWEIDGMHAEEVTRAFYRRVTAAAGDGSAESALALHHAVRELRGRLPDRPHLWAAYVYAGA
ncbi:CHAT domain-containing protein [Streptomyces sp. WI03-4A]|uniref:CHAT domain-containing protein n=1 Tax=Streptomyces sp. WI03-4A TaxID=3028706 RepID=UPI0029B3679B|nr:CHAT domain-containing protein [Streptomyces sp. WI03-4A]MDX2591281.1 CHAT domain-containing protein [Streptomyces sp. WI03-4A]